MGNGAVVFAGGGVAGVAWELGLLKGLDDVAPRALARILSPETLLVGTSAGATVAAQVGSGTPIAQLFDAQVAGASGEVFVELDAAVFGAKMAAAFDGASSAQEVRRRMGAIALAAETPSTQVRMAIIESRLPHPEWPDRRMLITAVDAETGELRVFDRDSGVRLVDAVAASSAVPGIWPTVTIDGHHYMDGGIRAIANADLAAGADPVLILVPGPEVGPMRRSIDPSELEALAPAETLVVYADDASLAAFGTNPLDPAVRRPAALAGREVGRRLGERIVEFWDEPSATDPSGDAGR